MECKDCKYRYLHLEGYCEKRIGFDRKRKVATMCVIHSKTTPTEWCEWFEWKRGKIEHWYYGNKKKNRYITHKKLKELGFEV